MFLAAIGILVPSDHWGLSPWRGIIPILVALAIVGLTLTLLSQSKEDHEREKKEQERDRIQQAIVTELASLSVEGKANSLTASGSTQEMQPTNPPVSFDAPTYFRLAYHSLWTADVEKRIKVAAAQNKAHYTTEEFYAKFIAVGLIAYLHDLTWAYIWKSQFLLLIELNRQGGVMPVGEAKAFYDQGAKDYPRNYANYSFDQWLVFIQTQQLIIRHPSEMLEITVRGRDFISYSAHHARTPDQRKA